MNKFPISFLILISFITFLSSCEKEEGPGGESTIKGKVMQKVYDLEYTVLQRTVPAAEEDVYIIYGDDDFVSDKVVTNYDGTFQFEYLMPGTYKLVVYSEDTTGHLQNKATVIREVTVGKAKSVDLDTLYVIKSVEYNEGYATISGRIRSINWTKDYFNIIDTTAAQDREVYLMYGNHKVYDQRYRTGYDGVYSFPNLIVGNYTMYIYSEDIYGAPEDDAVIFKFSVNEQNQFFDASGKQISAIPDLFINLEI